MRARSLVLALAVVLSACAIAARRDPAAHSPDALQLAGTQWRFVKLDGHVVPAGVKATLAFESNGHVSGHAGCNGYGGPWVASTGALHFGGMISTKMACLEPPGAMATEREVFAALHDTARASLGDGQLILLDANGAPLATLQTQRDQ
ncbi:MAG: META domain-containing protein [Rhodanobacteraceae bacterium]